MSSSDADLVTPPVSAWATGSRRLGIPDPNPGSRSGHALGSYSRNAPRPEGLPPAPPGSIWDLNPPKPPDAAPSHSGWERAARPPSFEDDASDLAWEKGGSDHFANRAGASGLPSEYVSSRRNGEPPYGPWRQDGDHGCQCCGQSDLGRKWLREMWSSKTVCLLTRIRSLFPL